MLRIFTPIFVKGEAVVLYSVFFVAKGITYLATKGVYASYLIKKQRYWPKLFPGCLIDTRFQYKDISAVEMLEARTQDNKPFGIFCLKDPVYVMKIMESWMTLDVLEGANTRR